MSLTDEIKARLPFPQLLSEYVDLPTIARLPFKIRCFHHDDKIPSMVIYNDGAYCHVCCQQWDIFNVFMEFEKCDFKEALLRLAATVGLATTQNLQQLQQQRTRENLLAAAVSFYEHRMHLPEGQECYQYALRRGWNHNTIINARLGYAAPDAGLKDYLHSKRLTPNGLLSNGGLDFCGHLGGYEKSPSGYLVYPHIQGMRVRYLAARSLEGKEHRNLPGKKQMYYNWLYNLREDEVILVEGQACAITLAQWGYPAVALCGATAGDEFRKHKRVFIVKDEEL